MNIQGAHISPADDAQVAEQWAYLQDILRAAHLPPARDRRGHQPHPDREVPPPYPGDCIVFLRFTESQWNLTLAAARVLPVGSLLWALCPSWLKREQGRLWCRRGIWADRSGQIYLDDFSPPREVTYFANFFTAADTYGARDDGHALEDGLSCPTSSTVEISEFIGCKVTTRLLALSHATVPRSVAFAMTFPHAADVMRETPAAKDLVRLEQISSADDAIVRARVENGLKQWPENITRVVVKPSGLLHMAAAGVTFHDRTDSAGITAAIVDLLKGRSVKTFRRTDAVLLEAYAGGLTKSMRIRAIVARTGARSGDCAAVCLVASIGGAGGPFSGVMEIPQPLATALANYGIGQQAPALEARVKTCAESAFAAITAREPRISRKLGGRTDLLGMDFILAMPGDEQPGQPALEPVLIEVNNHDCTDVTALVGFTTIDHSAPGISPPDGGAMAAYFKSLAGHSQRYRLAGKIVLVIGGVTISKRSVWHSARMHGVRVVLVNDQPVRPGDGLGAELLQQIVLPDLHADHSAAADARLCEAILRELEHLGIVPDGALTFWEDCTILTALIAERLGTRWHSPAAQRNVKDKLALALALTADVSPALFAFEPNVRTIAVPFAEIGDIDDLDTAAARLVPYPAVIRHRYGSSAVGTRLVISAVEARTEVGRLLSMMVDKANANATYGGVGFQFAEARPSVMLSTFVDGSEHDVDLVMFNGELVDAWVTDNTETETPYFAETCAVFPSRLSPGQQQQLINAAWQACRRAGLTDGVMNAELKLSRTGPKIIEINGRMGGFYIPAWVQAVWGYDLAAAAYQIACGIRPAGRARSTPRQALAGILLYPGDGSAPERVRDADTFIVPLGHSPQNATVEFAEPIASIAWAAADSKTAAHRLMTGLPALFPSNTARAALMQSFIARMPGGSSS